jgi:hypothetical protein
MMDERSKKEAIDAIANCTNCGDEKTLREYVIKHSLESGWTGGVLQALDAVKELPSAQPEYKPVKAEDFAKTMSENTLYSFMAWYGEALELMKRKGFVICKKTM